MSIFCISQPKKSCRLPARVNYHLSTARMHSRVISIALVGLACLLPVEAAETRAGADIPDKFKGIILYAPETDFPNPKGYFDRAQWIQGVYRLSINPKTGMVDEVKVVRGCGRYFDAGAVMTFFKWKFRPGALKRLDVPVMFGSHMWTNLKKAGFEPASPQAR
jgi:hypothetical protein